MSQATQRRPAPHGDRHLASQDKHARPDRRLGWLAFAVVAVLLGAFGVVTVLSHGSSTGSTVGATVNPAAAVPRGVDPATFAVPVAPEVTPKADAPQLDIWEDFQCSSCAQTEEAVGARLVALAQSGDARVSWRPATYLDARFSGKSSARATAAWGCAIDAGRTVAYHSQLFAAQSSVAGGGFTDAQLLEFGRISAITGDSFATFSRCVTSKRYQGWAANSHAEFVRVRVPGATSYLDGHGLSSGTLADSKALDTALMNARMARSGDDMGSMHMG